MGLWVRILPGVPMELGAAFPITSVLAAVGLALLLCIRWARGGGLAFLVVLIAGMGAAASSWWIGPVRGLKVGTQWETAAGSRQWPWPLVYWSVGVSKRRNVSD